MYVTDVVVSNENCRMDANVLHCYAELPRDNKMTAIKAQSACPYGTHLATITSQEEISLLYELKCKLYIVFNFSCDKFPWEIGTRRGKL